MVKNEDQRPHLIFVIHDVEGGVASMNHQIIENAPFRDHFEVHVILWRAVESKEIKFREAFVNVEDVTLFEFSQLDNHYLVLKKFNAILNRWTGVLVTNDGMELETVARFGTSSIISAIVHDFYNLRLAVDSFKMVDYFLCHTEVYSRA